MLDRKARNLERWFRLLNALEGGARPIARQLAQRFGVTPRTIFRDIAALEQMGVPMVREHGCYRLMDTYRIRPVQFTPEEVLAIVAALDFARRRRSLGGPSRSWPPAWTMPWTPARRPCASGC